MSAGRRRGATSVRILLVPACVDIARRFCPAILGGGTGMVVAAGIGCGVDDGGGGVVGWDEVCGE